MLQQLKRLGGETIIYGTSTIIGRFLNFLLVPLYTNVLLPGPYGIIAVVYSVIAFVNVIYSYGMESAYFKYSSTLEIGTPKENFTTPFISLLASSAFFSLMIIACASPLAGAMNLPAEFNSIVYYGAGILAFDALAIIPFASLRMERKAVQFASLKFLNIAVNVGMNVALLVGLHMGVEGIFISGLTASVLTFLLLVPTIVRHLSRGFHSGLLKALLKFGLPSIPAGLSATAVQVIDRPILRALTDDATVGIYQANYRLGIFMMLIVSMYDYAWRPFFFSMAKDPRAKEIFARALTYLVLLMSVIFLAVSFFIGDIVKLTVFGRHIISPNYWGGLTIVPVVLLGYLFFGVYINVSAGIYIEKKTHYLPGIMFLGAIVNVVANYLLIPSTGIMGGMMGAAWATFFAYLTMAVAGYLVAQRVYPVRYEGGRLLKLAGAVAAVMLIYPLFPVPPGAPALILKGGLLILFLLLMVWMKFFDSRELSLLRQLMTAARSGRGGAVAEEEPPVEGPDI
jgi:O-antigen/teichoic acid export membrane protein